MKTFTVAYSCPVCRQAVPVGDGWDILERIKFVKPHKDGGSPCKGEFQEPDVFMAEQAGNWREEP